MEIPFVVNARKDTGLFNSKVGIWLFLASEVTLFGGLFSGYLFLRLFADYPWPERTLPVLPGLINTFVLIGSSVTVVFAWAALKMRDWKKFQINMGITLACAALFMVLKGIEYNAKFHHQGIRLTGGSPVEDFAILEGHVHKVKLDGDKLVHAEKDDKEAFYANKLIFKAESLTFALKRPAHEAYLQMILDQTPEGTEITLADDYTVGGEVKMAKGEPLSIEMMDKLESLYLDAISKDSKVRTAFEKASWKWIREQPGFEDMQGTYVVEEKIWKDRRKEDVTKYSPLMLRASGEASFAISKPFNLVLDTDDVPPGLKRTEAQVVLRDDTAIKGKMLDSPVVMAVDAIDFRFTAMRAEKEGVDPAKAIATSWVLTHEPKPDKEGNPRENVLRKAWECHQAWLKHETARLKEKGKEPTENDKYRVNWDQMVAYERLDFDAEKVSAATEDGSLYETHLFDLGGFAGANHKKHQFPEVEIPRDKVGFESAFTPKWNTYYAIYFTITGLHGLHVIGGAIVLGYYLFFGRKMYESNPEWLANRVEVGGLFWHFVDLVWIFLFPILYLM
ncbi:MAG: cytochrome c oxidase subunit 3 [Akkermansiaceae bacterium]